MLPEDETPSENAFVAKDDELGGKGFALGRKLCGSEEQDRWFDVACFVLDAVLCAFYCMSRAWSR